MHQLPVAPDHQGVDPGYGGILGPGHRAEHRVPAHLAVPGEGIPAQDVAFEP